MSMEQSANEEDERVRSGPKFTDEFGAALLACLIECPDKFAFCQGVWQFFVFDVASVNILFRLKGLLTKIEKPTLTAVIEAACREARKDFEHGAERLKDVLALGETLRAIDVSRELPTALLFVREWYFQRRHDLAVNRYLEATVALRQSRSNDPTKKAERDFAHAKEGLVHALVGTGHQFIEATDATELLETELPDQPMVIENTIQIGDVALVGSGSKSFKTWLAIHVAVCVVSGASWWGFSTTMGKVAYLNFELKPRSFQNRLRSVIERLGVTLERNSLTIFHLRGADTASLNNLVDSLILHLRGKGYTMIVVDPLYILHQGKAENAAEEMAEQMTGFGRLAKETGAAVWISHHFSKGNQASKEAMDRFSGSGVFSRYSDVIITLTTHKVRGAFTVNFILRDQPEVLPFCVRWVYPILEPDSELDPEDLKKPNRSAANEKFSPQKVLNLLPSAGLTYTEWEQAAIEVLGMSDSTFKRKLEHLEKEKSVENRNGKWLRAKTSKIGNAQNKA